MKILVYVLALLFGVSAGFLDVTVGDLLATAIFVMIATMVLGFLRPGRAWQWTILVGVFVPAAHVLAYLLWRRHSNLAETWESGLVFVIGTVGAYAGAFTRKVISELFGAR